MGGFFCKQPPQCERRAGKRLFLAVRNALLLRWIFFALKRVILFFRGWVFFPVRLGIWGMRMGGD
jgi:hypothetical protein